MFSGGGYNLSIYGRSGKESNKTIGSQHAGNLSLKYLYQEEEDIKEEEESTEDYDYLPNKANSKIVHSLPMGATDPGALIATDKGAGQLKNLGGAGGGFLQEFAGYHKNTIRKGISPFKQPKHSGPPLGTGGSNQAFKTTGNKIDLGSRRGWSRPYYSKNKGNKKRYFSLMSLIQDTKSGGHSQFVRQKNRIKKVLASAW